MENILKNIKAIALDIDGILTDGSIHLIGPGSDNFVRTINAKDSFAVRAAGMKGFILSIISGADTSALQERCSHMGVKKENLFLGCRGKFAYFERFCRQNGLDPGEVAYFGDDIPDTQVLRACGLGIVPSDAVPEAKAVAKYVTAHAGGKGCVREGIELILKAQDKWFFDEDKFDRIF